MLLIALWLQLNAAYAQYPTAVPAPPGSPSEADRTIEAIESIEKATREMKKSANMPEQKCWTCAFEKAPVCSFGDVCRALKDQAHSNKLYSKPDGTYVPNVDNIADSKIFNQCRTNASQYLDMLPEKYQTQMKDWTKRQIDFMKFVEKRGAEKVYLRISRALIETAQTGVQPRMDRAGTLAKIETAEKAEGIKLPADVKEEWVKSAAVELISITLPQPIHINDDPLMDPESLTFIQAGKTKESVLKAQARYQTQFERAEKIFFNMQKRVVAVLEKRRTKGNTEQIDNLITRVKTTKFVPNLNPQDCPSPNGSYEPPNHRIAICPQNLAMPDGAIERTLAHELGHAIDPCVSTADLARYENKSSEFKGVPSGTVYGNVVSFNPKANDRDPKYFYSNLPGTGEALVKGISPGDYPLNSVVTCIVKDSSLGAAQGGLGDKIAALKKDLRIKKDSGASEATLGEIEKLIAIYETAEADERTKRCGQNGSQLQEAMSDWLSAEVLADSLSDDKNQARQEVFESASGLAPMACVFEREPNSDVLSKGIAACLEFKEPKSSGYYASGGSYGSGYGTNEVALREKNTGPVHPETADRISKILLAHPKIREKIGCPKTAVEHCD